MTRGTFDTRGTFVPERQKTLAETIFIEFLHVDFKTDIKN